MRFLKKNSPFLSSRAIGEISCDVSIAFILYVCDVTGVPDWTFIWSRSRVVIHILQFIVILFTCINISYDNYTDTVCMHKLHQFWWRNWMKRVLISAVCVFLLKLMLFFTLLNGLLWVLQCLSEQLSTCNRWCKWYLLLLDLHIRITFFTGTYLNGVLYIYI